MEEKQLYGCLTVYRERGRYLRQLEQIEKAKVAYDEAFKSNPQDVRTLLGKSQVCADAVKPKQAYDDAELALQLEPNNMIARNMQARAMYTLSDFERSLVMNYRGYWKRRQPPYFLEGINQGLETINDCVGKNAGSVMIDFLSIIKQQEKENILDDDTEPARPKRVSRIPKPEETKKMTQLEARKHRLLARELAMKYLGPMAEDKFFLQELTNDHRVKSANAVGSVELQEVINEAYRSLSERQEMLRAQRPYYSVKFSEKSESKYQNKYKKLLLKQERQTGARTCDNLLRQVDAAMRSSKMRHMLSLAEQMQKLLDSKTPTTLPDKSQYIDRLYKIVGEGYLNQHRLSYKLSEKSNRRRIAFLMGLPVARPTSYDSVCANYPFKFADLERVTQKVYDTLEMCENSMMRCFLLYEMSRLHSYQKNFPMSKYYAKRCQREATEVNSNTWWMNGLFALMSGDMQQGNTNEVKIQVEEAIKFSKKMQDPEAVQAFLSKCEDIASKAVSSDERKAVLQREKEILRIMEEPEKVELQVLFKRISTVPLGRRFSVLPRKPEASISKAERRKRKQLGLTVVPGAPKALPPMPKSPIPGHQVFDL